VRPASGRGPAPVDNRAGCGYDNRADRGVRPSLPKPAPGKLKGLRHMVLVA
jgi:hypothetical protein